MVDNIVKGVKGCISIPLEIRFFKFVTKTDSCWLWTGVAAYPTKWPWYKSGIIYHNGRHIKASRASWMIHNGEIPKGLCVLHRCDNPLCVNPDHLFLGTHQDNMNDMMAKGRNNNLVGEENGSSKLTKEQVLKIRSEAGSFTEIAGKYGVSKGCIQHIKDRKTWKWLA